MTVSGEPFGDTARAADVEIGRGNCEPVAGKRAGGRLADAAGCPGYNCNPLHMRPLDCRGAS